MPKHTDHGLQEPHPLTPQHPIKAMLIIYIKGITMGAADIVPGVSGGTIALIAGIYQRLINALSSIGPHLLPLWRRHGMTKGFVTIWQQVDATFLLCLLLGIASSFLTLAGTITYLLEYQPLAIWSFFFGLVVATVLLLLAEIEHWTVLRIVLFLIGVIVAVLISTAPIMETSPTLPFLFMSGALAICAMILPGVSGSFILLLLGVYAPILEALHLRQLPIIVTVLAGMVVGLLSFTRLLRWLLANYYQSVLALLTGFVAGSLVKVYPFKVSNINVLPWHYLSGWQWAVSFSLMLLGAILVTGLSWWGKQTAQK